MRSSKVIPKRRFQLILIKPSHYGDDGYVIRWWRSMIPAQFAREHLRHSRRQRRARSIGCRHHIDIEAIDEFNSRVDISRLLKNFSRNENFGLVALIGVQSNHIEPSTSPAGFARPISPVAIGGFHVSGCLSMLDGRAIELDACREMAVSIFAGEAEGRFDMLLQDAAADRLQPREQFPQGFAGYRGNAGAPAPAAR